MNAMEIQGYKAVVKYDPEIEMFRGEFTALNGGADFYATNIAELRKEGETSLKIFLKMCQEEGVEPKKQYSGKFNLRISPELHADVATKAATEGKSLNQCVADILKEAVHN
ncbi:MAG: toxin-antitoxin system HicB family antitoxin [Acidobacteria bacterium]|nr:MAG: toxin-antitoxin system HicB family antitoxin [Acidobacteriota bacterium]PIE89122.1 MAG: toxin-antitoxin system HicB family antitoxin [Acidobacteriota bacterium]